MHEEIILQGRCLKPADIDYVRELIVEHPSWSRRKLSVTLSKTWNWRNAKGTIKDMACRSLLLKLHDRGYIQLPERRQQPTSRMSSRHILNVDHDTTPIHQSLSTLRPLRVVDIRTDKDYEPLFNCLLSRYHYLGYSSSVGENMKYLIVDCIGRPLACLLFGSSAWSCVSRDADIGWEGTARQRNIQFVTNNTRFLIFPWITVPHLASHVLAMISRRISTDWLLHYGHEIYLLETFVDQTRYSGTCYRAANWRQVGQTRGRGRNDRHTKFKVPLKLVFLYPLTSHYQTKLQH